MDSHTTRALTGLGTGLFVVTCTLGHQESYMCVFDTAAVENSYELILNNYLGEVPLDAATGGKTNPC